MKKVLVSAIVCSVMGMADGYTQADRILDMQKMAQAMQDIQSGFFYNNLDIVKAGAKDLSDTIVKIGPTKAEKENKDVYERWMNNHTAMTARTQRRIQKYAETLVERFQDGDAVQALQVYNRVSAECMKCHVDLRKW
ncbi:MAG: cytochrome C [Campylobacterota bacterium]|nr:cytochrome C [Campylobacterota bacterium]